ncbi:MAG TPA: hypothetical protein VI298_16270 [Geobacteraceae bacterium]
MNTQYQDIYPNQVRGLIQRLFDFFGTHNIESALKSYEKSLVSSGSIYREYYLRKRHPWWEAILAFRALEAEGKAIKRHMTADLKRLAGDARKILILQKLMSTKVREKYKRDLLDENRAFDFLFEIQTAWHYFLKGYQITWYDEDGRPDFKVNTPTFDFDVECKRLTVDASRKIRRRDFYRLLDLLLPKLDSLGLCGSVDIILSDRLHSNTPHLQSIALAVYELAKAQPEDMVNTDFGEVTLKLERKPSRSIDMHQMYMDLWDRKPPESHAVIFASAQNDRSVDPIEILVRSNKSERIVDGIKTKIEEAALKQLGDSRPGLIACFLEDVNDLSSLAKESSLQLMSSYVLNKPENSHLAGVLYRSELRVIDEPSTEHSSFQTLIFRNPQCKFEEAKGFAFASRELEF